MCNHTAVAKGFVAASCTLAIALLIIGMCVISSLAGADQSSELKFTPISSYVVVQPIPAARPTQWLNVIPLPSNETHVTSMWKRLGGTRHLTANCQPLNKLCFKDEECCSHACSEGAGYRCVPFK